MKINRILYTMIGMAIWSHSCLLDGFATGISENWRAGYESAPHKQGLLYLNPGEAVLVSFLEERFFRPEDWTIGDGTTHGLNMQKAYRMFHGAMFEWLRRPEGGLGFEMGKTFGTDVSGFDELAVAAVLPEGGRLEVMVRTDRGTLLRTFDKYADDRREYIVPLEGAVKIEELTLRVFCDEEGTQAGAILWIIVQNREKYAEYLASLLPFGKTWDYHLKSEEYRPAFLPEYGVVFSEDELPAVRRRHREIIEREGDSRYTEAARELMAVDPEDLIRQTLGKNIRFARDYMLGRPELNGGDLAIAGILMEDPEMLRVAARYALTLAMTPSWTEGFMAHLPGSQWVHAAFMESYVTHQLGIILDLAGEMFTEAGRDLIIKRMAVDGLSHINYITWRYEYIHRMNQLAVFSHGRMIAYAILGKTMPRVAPYLDIAYRELYESLQTIFLPDGGNVEGPHYMLYTVSEAGLALWYYAKATGKPLDEVMPPNMLRSGQFAELFYSSTPDNDVIPVGDAYPWVEWMDGVAFLASVSPDSRWADLYLKIAERMTGISPDHNRKSTDRTSARREGFLALVSEPPSRPSGKPTDPFVHLPEMGYMASVRELDGHLLKIVVPGNKAGAGHNHEDKGSFVIEFAGEIFAIDPGVTTYGHAMTFISKQAQWHNMLVPAIDDRRAAPSNPVREDMKPEGRGDEREFHVRYDVTPAWENEFLRNIRSWESTSSDRLTIVDDYSVKDGKSGVRFLWHTPLPVTVRAGRAVLTGKKGSAEIALPRGTRCIVEPLVLWDGRTINRIIITSDRPEGTLRTEIKFKTVK